MSWYPIQEYIQNIQRLKYGNTQLLLPWLEKHNVIRFSPAGHGLDWERALKTGRKSLAREQFRPENDPPYLDHGRLLKSRDGRVWLVYHPYEPEDSVRAALLLWAEKHRLNAEVFDAWKSWYYPGETCMAVVWADEEYERRKDGQTLQRNSGIPGQA